MAFKINDERAPLDQFLQGESVRAYEFLGSHFVNWDGRQGVVFRVWAPNALSVSVVGDFNDWNNDANFMYKISDGGVWELFIEGIPEFACYKYCVETPWHERRLKTDPYAFIARLVPTTHPVFTRLTATSGMMKSGMTTKRASAQEYACQCLRGKRRFLA